jgi:hypothetical protein
MAIRTPHTPYRARDGPLFSQADFWPRCHGEKLSVEGRKYVIQDEDVCYFLFNV